MINLELVGNLIYKGNRLSKLTLVGLFLYNKFEHQSNHFTTTYIWFVMLLVLGGKMNRVYLLLSFLLFMLIIFISYDASEVQSYIDGNIMLKVYSLPAEGIVKREYFVDGIRARMLEYTDDSTTTETIYDSTGRKITVNIFENGKLIKTTNYKAGFWPMVFDRSQV